MEATLSLVISSFALAISFLAFRRDARYLTVRFDRNVMHAAEGASPVERLPLAEWFKKNQTGFLALQVPGNEIAGATGDRVACVTIINDGRRPNRVESFALLTEGYWVMGQGFHMKELAEGQHCQYEFPEHVLTECPEEPFAAIAVDIYNTMYVSKLGWSRRDFKARWRVFARNVSFAVGIRKR